MTEDTDVWVDNGAATEDRSGGDDGGASGRWLLWVELPARRRVRSMPLEALGVDIVQRVLTVLVENNR